MTLPAVTLPAATLAALPPAQRDVVTLRDIHDPDGDEVRRQCAPGARP